MTEKKVAAVTGSRRGIGKGIAQALANEGYEVIISGVTAAEALTEAADTFGNVCNPVYIRCDISCPDDRANFFNTIQSVYGRLDLLVNNAGVAPRIRADLLDMPEESFDHVMDTNLKGTFFMCQAAARMMIECVSHVPGCRPRIINIGSISAYTASINRGEYCISKAGIGMVTQLFAARLAEYGIPVFEIRPGIIMTDMTAAVADRYGALIRDGLTPVSRMGTPEDVARCVIAACALPDFATGQVINADGGFHIRRL